MNSKNNDDFDMFGIIGLLGAKFLRFDVDYFYSIIQFIEKNIGELQFLPYLSDLPSVSQSAYKDYFLENALGHLISLWQYKNKIKSDPPVVINERILVSSNKIQYPPEANIPIDIKKKFEETGKIDLFSPIQYGINNRFAIERHIVSWEFLLSNFVNPIFLRLFEKKLIPKEIKKQIYPSYKLEKHQLWPNKVKIMAVQSFLNSYSETKPLIPLLDDLNPDLRNALIHESYFIQEQVIHYFKKPRKGNNIKIKKIDVMRLHIMNLYQIFHIFLITILIGMKFADKNELKKKFGLE